MRKAISSGDVLRSIKPCDSLLQMSRNYNSGFMPYWIRSLVHVKREHFAISQLGQVKVELVNENIAKVEIKPVLQGRFVGIRRS